jgi:stearoyl-CoA desaturase (delta-9 desaturase)
MKTEGITTPDVRPPWGLQTGDPVWLAFARVGGRHLGAIAALLFVPPSAPLVTLLVVSYLIRIWAMEAVYHRYFAHATYQAGRLVQFLLALLGTQCGQRGPLWWAATHRTHHRYADTPRDPHSPADQGFLHAHAGWLTDGRYLVTDLDVVADYARFPELRWLNKYYYVPLYLAVPALYLAGDAGWLGTQISGLAAVLWGGFLPTTLALHMTSLVNSVGHMPGFPGGYRRYPTVRDDSMNRPLLGLLTLGAGWHNNHHRYGAAARSGFAWYEIDVVFWSLRVLRKLRVIRHVKDSVPEAILREGGLRPVRDAGLSHPPRAPAESAVVGATISRN